LTVDVKQSYSTQVNGAHSATALPLSHELQLGDQLNECVHQTRRADFSLMLAMLAEDVREHSQFSLPSKVDATEANSSETALRKKFQLPNSAPLALKSMEEIASFNQAGTISANDLASIRLSNAIAPKPLAFRDDKKHISHDVIANTSVHCQVKLSQAAQSNEKNKAQDDVLLNHTLPFNAEGWLSGIQESLVQSSMIN
jgi:hypothetical protein